MADIGDETLKNIYEQLKDRFPIRVSSSLELAGFQQAFLVLHGVSPLGPFDVYHDGQMYIFELNYSPTEPYPHWHPETAGDIVKDIKNLMAGRYDLLDGLDI